jgi:hypothetical protein
MRPKLSGMSSYEYRSKVQSCIAANVPISSADGIANVELWSMEESIPHLPLFFRVGANGIKVLAEKKLEVSTES